MSDLGRLTNSPCMALVITGAFLRMFRPGV
nr:MAG TPA: hypothetical protein [Caudoviricetes sp.]